MTRDGNVDLVLEGGGVKGVGLVGAITELEAAGYRFMSVGGTSAGAVIGTLLAAGYDGAALKKVIMDLDFTRMMDASWLGRIPIIGPTVSLYTRLGIFEGDFLLGLMRDLLGQRGIRTFRDYARRGPDAKVRVIASDITRGRMLVLPDDIREYGVDPDDLEVALAVRMSLSIPYFFKPVRLQHKSGQMCHIVDGAILSLFPVGIFDVPGTPAWPTFGVQLVNSILRPTSGIFEVQGPLTMLRAMVCTAMSARDQRHIDTHDFVRTITVDSLGIPEINFYLSMDDKLRLYEAGRSGAQAFLAKWDFDRYVKLYRSGQPEPSRRELSLGLSNGHAPPPPAP